MDISVVICVYTEERWHDFLSAFDSVQKQSVPPREIIVVVDHNARLLERVLEHAPGAVVIENGEVHGLAGARNCGMRVAKGAVIAFLDDDAVADPGWLEELSAGYEDPVVMGVGGSIRPMWSNGRPRWFPEEFDWVVGCTYRGMPSATTHVRNFLGCNMSFRREVFEAIGSFRNSMGRVDKRPLGCEETEFCIRALQHWPEKALAYRPSAQVYHRVPASRARGDYFLSRCYSEGLSKAMVARFVGAGDGLASERTYTFKTLPRGGARGLKDAVFCGDLAGLGRTGAIVAGLGSTTFGYVVGTFFEWATTMEKWLKRRVEESG